MQTNFVQVRVPASTANLGPGFDTLGLAFQLYTTVRMAIAEETSITFEGEELQGLTADKENLLYTTASLLFKRAGLAVPELAIMADSEIPLTRGLGSSAAAIVGALVAANVLAGEPFQRDQLFDLASELEGHPDNVGASLFGGMIVATMPEAGESVVPYVQISLQESLRTLVLIPDYWVSTEKARHVLPAEYSRADAVYNIGHSSLLVAALAQGRYELLAKAMQDRLHQPYRTTLIPGLSELLAQATDYGALGAALSGAGPTTLFFFREDSAKERLLAFADTVMAKYRISYRMIELAVDNQGAQIL